MAFAKRKISLQFMLGQGDFGESGSDTVTLDGLRCSANIVYGGSISARAELQIYGMKLDVMRQLTVLQTFFWNNYRNNTVTVLAGDKPDAMSQCFSGDIFEAWVEAKSPPDVSFYVSAITQNHSLKKAVPAISFKGNVDAGTVAEIIAQQMEYTLENSGVNAQLNNPYFPGSVQNQLDALCRAAGCQYYLDENRRILAIWPLNGNRVIPPVTVSAKTGLVGYPSFTQGGIRFTTLYNPLLTFGAPIIMQSQLAPANGRWAVYQLAHRIESNVPGGQWYSDVECTYMDHQA